MGMRIQRLEHKSIPVCDPVSIAGLHMFAYKAKYSDRDCHIGLLCQKRCHHDVSGWAVFSTRDRSGSHGIEDEAVIESGISLRPF